MIPSLRCADHQRWIGIAVLNFIKTRGTVAIDINHRLVRMERFFPSVLGMWLEDRWSDVDAPSVRVSEASIGKKFRKACDRSETVFYWFIACWRDETERNPTIFGRIDKREISVDLFCLLC